MASRADVALYIVLCSLAVLDRRDLKTTVLDRPNIAAVLESDTQSRDLLESFFACEYKKTLATMEKMKNRIRLDIHLSSHYATLVEAITRRALRQFVQPFDSLKIERLATSMGWSGIQGQERAVNELISLIQKGEIQGKLDVIDKVSQNLYDQRVVHSKLLVCRCIMQTRWTLVRLFSMALSRWDSSVLLQQSVSSCGSICFRISAYDLDLTHVTSLTFLSQPLRPIANRASRSIVGLFHYYTYLITINMYQPNAITFQFSLPLVLCQEMIVFYDRLNYDANKYNPLRRCLLCVAVNDASALLLEQCSVESVD
jgi:hypothetical protein